MKKKYWKSLTIDQRKELAKALDTSTEYLRQVFMYDRKVGAVRARKLQSNTGLGAYEFCDAFSESDVLVD